MCNVEERVGAEPEEQELRVVMVAVPEKIMRAKWELLECYLYANCKPFS